MPSSQDNDEVLQIIVGGGVGATYWIGMTRHNTPGGF